MSTLRSSSSRQSFFELAAGVDHPAWGGWRSEPSLRPRPVCVLAKETFVVCDDGDFSESMGVGMCRNLRLSAFVFATASFWAVTPASAKDYVLSFKGVDVRPGERIVGLEIHGENLTLASVVHMPNGWSLKIDTDPAGTTDILGAVIVGAAALSLGMLNRRGCFAILRGQRMNRRR